MFSNKKVIIGAYLYLLIPIVSFILGWVRLYYSIPLTIGLLWGGYQAVSSFPKINIKFKIDKKLFAILLILAGWVVLSGVGGCVWQNRWDHMFRNAIFLDLCNNSWPVVNFQSIEPRMLCYYFGFWLPSALVAKVFNNISIGYIFQLIYAYVGITLVVLLIFEWLHKISLKVVFVVILFSGLDIISYFLFLYWGTDTFSISNLLVGHKELLLLPFNSSSNTTLLFWLYNQFIPFAVGFMLLIQQKNTSVTVFTYSLLLLFAPFPSVTIAPIIIYECIAHWRGIKALATFPNVIGVFLMGIIALFYLANNALGSRSFISLDRHIILRFIFYILIEFVIFMPFIWRKIRSNVQFWLLFIVTMICSFISLNGGHDFAARTSIPLAFYIMLMVIHSLNSMNGLTSIKAKILIAILCVGALNPISEFGRTIINTEWIITHKKNESFLSDELKTVFDDNPCYDNFVATGESFFNKYLRK